MHLDGSSRQLVMASPKSSASSPHLVTADHTSHSADIHISMAAKVAAAIAGSGADQSALSSSAVTQGDFLPNFHNYNPNILVAMASLTGSSPELAENLLKAEEARKRRAETAERLH